MTEEKQFQLSPQAQQLLLQLQTFQQQLQAILIQKESMTLQNIDIEKALEELKKTKSDVYKAVGPILIKSAKNELGKELNEKKETIDLRLKSLEKQEIKLKEKIKENQEKLQDFLKSKTAE